MEITASWDLQSFSYTSINDPTEGADVVGITFWSGSLRYISSAEIVIPSRYVSSSMWTLSGTIVMPCCSVIWTTHGEVFEAGTSP